MEHHHHFFLNKSDWFLYNKFAFYFERKTVEFLSTLRVFFLEWIASGWAAIVAKYIHVTRAKFLSLDRSFYFYCYFHMYPVCTVRNPICASLVAEILKIKKKLNFPDTFLAANNIVMVRAMLYVCMCGSRERAVTTNELQTIFLLSFDFIARRTL